MGANIYDAVVEMERFPNFQGAKILGFCLNVMGFTVRNDKNHIDSNALQRAILCWTKRNFLWLYSYNPRVAEACLVDGITYEQEHLRLVRTYPVEGLRRETKYSYLKLDPQPQPANVKKSPMSKEV